MFRQLPGEPGRNSCDCKLNAPISVVVPTRNAAGLIGGTLASLYEGLDIGLIRDLVICDGGSRDAIAEIADEVGAVLVRSEAGRGTQLAAGAAAAKGDWLLFLHADTRLSPGWTSEVAAHMEGSPEKAAYFKLEFDSNSSAARAVAAWANFRSRVFDLPYGDQGLLLSRELYDSIGGFPRIPVMEDVAVAKRLKGRMLMLNCKAQHRRLAIRGARMAAARAGQPRSLRKASAWRKAGKHIGKIQSPIVSYLVSRNWVSHRRA